MVRNRSSAFEFGIEKRSDCQWKSNASETIFVYAMITKRSPKLSSVFENGPVKATNLLIIFEFVAFISVHSYILDFAKQHHLESLAPPSSTQPYISFLHRCKVLTYICREQLF